MAQSDHMKFMGIPLDGTINSFQNKLSAKGITPDDKLNKSLQVGVRGFKGNFAGHEAEIFVYYDAKSKIVYRAKACIESEIKNVAEQNYNTIKSQLKDKYYDKSIIDTDTYEGHESLHFLLLFGVIDLYFNSYSEGYPTIYSVHIDYSDIENYNKYKNSVMDDL
jgi:hypothetical protein